VVALEGDLLKPNRFEKKSAPNASHQVFELETASGNVVYKTLYHLDTAALR
jgi:hypothetical protein